MYREKAWMGAKGLQLFWGMTYVEIGDQL